MLHFFFFFFQHSLPSIVVSEVSLDVLYERPPAQPSFASEDTSIIKSRHQDLVEDPEIDLLRSHYARNLEVYGPFTPLLLLLLLFFFKNLPHLTPRLTLLNLLSPFERFNGFI